jgi:hypothetical protein
VILAKIHPKCVIISAFLGAFSVTVGISMGRLLSRLQAKRAEGELAITPV